LGWIAASRTVSLSLHLIDGVAFLREDSAVFEVMLGRPRVYSPEFWFDI
jgi:hypothetical protein